MADRLVSVDDAYHLPDTVVDQLRVDTGIDSFPETYSRIRQAALEVNEDFSLYPEGTIGSTLTGIPFTTYGGSADRIPRIVGGTLTYDTTAVQGGYASVQLKESATRLGARFVFDAGTGSGLATMAAMENEIGASIGAGSGVPRSPLHFWVSPTGWSFDVFVTAGAAPTTLASGTFATPLASDGVTVHTAEVVLDQRNGVAFVTLPDGSVLKIVSTHIKRLARWVYWEPYRTASAATRPRFVEAWASSHSGSELSTVNQITRAAQGPVWFAESTNPGTDMTLTTTTQDVPGCVVTYPTPPDGKVLVTLSGVVTETTAGEVRFIVKYPGGGNIVSRGVGGSGMSTVIVPVTITGPVGFPRTISFGVYQAAGAHTLKLVPNYAASIKVEHYRSS